MFLSVLSPRRHLIIHWDTGILECQEDIQKEEEKADNARVGCLCKVGVLAAQDFGDSVHG